MNKVIDWYLPEELLDLISNGLFSNVELLRFRSICKTWRSSAAINKRLLNDLNRKCNRRRCLPPYSGHNSSLSPAAFYRVVLSSCPDKGWLIKTQDVEDLKDVEYVESVGDVKDVEVSSKKQLLLPLSRRSINSSDKTLDLLKYTVSEIRQSYKVDCSSDFARAVVVEDLVFVLDNKRQICCSRSDDDIWTRIMDEEVKQFSDIILHKGHVYALDLTRAIWWISLSELQIYQFGPSTPLDYYEIDSCKEKRLVEYCEEGLSVIHRFSKKFIVEGYHIERTIGFKVYKMDEELVQWVEVKSLGNKAFVMATDSCFSVVASEYYGCLESSIYFTDEEKRGNVKVFKLGDGSITNRVDSFSQSCFQMLSPPFI